MKRKSIAALVATPANRQFIITLTLAVTALISGSQVQGAVKIWVGNTSADLAGSTNYTTANAPVSGDSFVFGAAGTAGVALTNGLAAT